CARAKDYDVFAYW
nr:immunoglobulin heavy chain junction region [Mus musculus]